MIALFANPALRAILFWRGDLWGEGAIDFWGGGDRQTAAEAEASRQLSLIKTAQAYGWTKPDGRPSDSSAKPDVNLSLHPAPQPLGACHAYPNELGRGNADVAVSDCPIDYFDAGSPPCGLPAGHLT